MAGEQNPNFPGDEGPGSTVVAVPRVGVPAPQLQPVDAPEAGGTMVGIGRVPPLRPPAGIPAQPPDAGGTMVGMGRVNIPSPFAPPAAPPAAPDAGGTMVGIPRPAFGARSFAPNFGSMAMPISTTPPSDAGATMVGVGRVPAPGSFGPPPAETGGTMVGIGRVPAPPPAAFGASAPEAGGTMVGIGRVPTPAGGFGAPVDAGGTMVGIGRLGAAPAAFGAQHSDAGGTMVGISPLAAPPAAFGAAGEAGGTMVGIPAASFGAPAASFAAPARPVGPPPAYEIIAHLGGGELGEVYHARRFDDGAEVALRVIRPEVADVPGAVDALRDVVTMAANAQHTHLGKQYELDETASPTLVVEYVPGKLLSSLMKERGAAPPPAVIDLGVRLCSALAAAHAAGLAHGRVHPGNVVLEAKTGRWVMLDLGHGYAVQGLEPAHDLYALGALLYEMATGHSPFEVGDTPPDPRSYKPTLPASLSALLLRTTSPNPAVWFGSAIELAQALARAKNLP